MSIDNSIIKDLVENHATMSEKQRSFDNTISLLKCELKECREEFKIITKSVDTLSSNLKSIKYIGYGMLLMYGLQTTDLSSLLLKFL